MGLLSPILRRRDAGLLSAYRGAGTGGRNPIALRTQSLELVVEPALVGVVLRSRSQQRPSRVISESRAHILRHTVRRCKRTYRNPDKKQYGSTEDGLMELTRALDQLAGNHRRSTRSVTYRPRQNQPNW